MGETAGYYVDTPVIILNCGAQRIIIVLGVKLHGGSNKVVKGCVIDYA